MIVRDPVHGDLEFDEIERQLMDTAGLQRLRGIRQTGTAYLVYPGCVHTRFEHSLGTSAMAKRILETLRRKGFAVTSEQETTVRIAALVHDVSHLPFGHTFEDERKLFPRHDTVERMQAFLTTGDLGEALEKTECREEVLALLTDRRFQPRWMRQIVSSTIDADLLDYLRRDAYFAGLRQDYDDRIFSTFVIEEDRLAVNLEKISTRTELLHLLRLRYFLTERVYYHHAKVASGAMIAKAVELAAAGGITETDLFSLSDEGLFRMLLDSEDARIRALVGRVKSRQLLKRAYALSAGDIGRSGRDELIQTYNRSIESRQQVENEVAENLGLPAEEVILYCPDISSIKEARVDTVSADGLRKLNEPADNPPLDVKAVEDQYERLWKLYVFVPETHRREAGPVCERILGETNGIRR